MNSRIFDFTLYSLPPALQEDIKTLGLKEFSGPVFITQCIPPDQSPEDVSQMEIFNKILAAVSLIPGKNALHLDIMRNKGLLFKKILRFPNINPIIVFGAKPVELGVNFKIENYSPTSWKGRTILFSDSLEEIEKDKILKKRLWLALQNIFKKDE